MEKTMKNMPVIWKVNAETYKVTGTNIYAMKNPFGAWEVLSNDKIVADNLSLKEAKKEMTILKNDLILSKTIKGGNKNGKD